MLTLGAALLGLYARKRLPPEQKNDAAPGLKFKGALSVAYGAGLRVSEVVALKVSDIDSQRMTLRVEQSKGQRDRYVMLSPQLLERLCHVRAFYLSTLLRTQGPR